MDEQLDKKCVDSCCYCLSLQQGSFTFMVIHILFLVIRLSLFHQWTTGELYFFMASGAAYVPLAIIFIFGALKRDHRCMIPYIIFYGAVSLCMEFIVIGTRIFRTAHKPPGREKNLELTSYLAYGCALIGTEFYMVIVLYSLFKDIQENPP